jgi:hypothetical protein
MDRIVAAGPFRVRPFVESIKALSWALDYKSFDLPKGACYECVVDVVPSVGKYHYQKVINSAIPPKNEKVTPLKIRNIADGAGSVRITSPNR